MIDLLEQQRKLEYKKLLQKQMANAEPWKIP